MATNKTDDRSNVSPVNDIVVSIMRNADKDGGLQRSLVLLMFESEVTFSEEAIRTLLRSKDSETRVTALMSELSPDFGLMEAQRERIKSEAKKLKGKKGENANKDPLLIQAEELGKKLNAAKSMFKRAATAVFYLRRIKADNLEPAKATAGSLTYTTVRGQGKRKGEVLLNTHVDTGNGLVRAGEKLLPPRPNPNRAKGAGNTGADVGAKGIPMTINTLETFLSMSGKPLDDYEEEEGKALDSLFARMFYAKFADDTGKIDLDSVKEYAESVQKPKALNADGNEAETPKSDKPSIAVPPRKNGNGKPEAAPKAA